MTTAPPLGVVGLVMCNLFLYLNTNPKLNAYKLIIANNRDEIYNKPTENAHIWNTNPKIIAGKDLARKGTWLCASDKGKIACLLNIFRPPHLVLSDEQVTSRGNLPLDFMMNDKSSLDYIKQIRTSNLIYNKFNLVLLEPKEDKFEAVIYDSFNDTTKTLDSGEFYGFGNNIITNSFKKIEKGKDRFVDIVGKFGSMNSEKQLIEGLIEMMSITEKCFPDPVLQSQGKGVPEEILKQLSSCFVNIPVKNYGTRTMSVILVDNDDTLKVHEQTMHDPSPTCTQWDKSDFSFKLNSPSTQS